MVSAIDSALSGLSAATKRIGVSANNLANISSTQSQVDGKAVNKPYTPQRIDQISLTNGGIEVKVRDVEPATQTVYDPNNVAAKPDGSVEVPNIDQAAELINLKIASYDFKANLKTIKLQSDLDQSLLDILT